MAEDVWDWKVEDKKVIEPNTVVMGDVAVNPYVPNMVSIVVVAFNTAYHLLHYTGNCLGSIKEHTDKEKTPYEIILVDNGSPLKFDNPADYGVEKYVKNQQNLGVAHAWNQGIRISGGDFICLLNNDTMVFDHWLEDLLEGLNHTDLVMATPMYGEPFSRAVEAAKKRDQWLNRPYEESLSDFRDFSCVLTYKEVFAGLGLFDEQFFAYNEDLDLLKRMDMAGLKYASTKKVNIFHVIGATSGEIPETPKIMDESREKLKNKVYSQVEQVVPLAETPEVWGEDVPSEEVAPEVYTIDNVPVLIRTAETGDKVFLVKDKITHWVASPEILEALGYDFGDVIGITRDLLYQLEPGEQITLENVAGYKKNEA